MNHHVKSLAGMFLILVTTLLASCGGGGGAPDSPPPTPPPASTLITGTAAAGEPVFGYVSVRDASTKAQPVMNNIAIVAGKYTVDVKGLTPPFAFLASGTVGGKSVQMYSVATQADIGGTINITPFTDLIVRNVAGTLVDTFLASGKLASLTVAQVEAERKKLTDLLTPALLSMGVPTSIDLMRAVFNADGTGLDRFMDQVKVDTTVATAVTITNIMDAANKLTVNPLMGTTTGGTVLSTTGLTPIATPNAVDLIRQTFATFSGFFATALPNPATPGLTALFATSFMDGGQNSSAFLTEVTTKSLFIGVKFGANGLVFDSIDSVNGTAQVSFVPVNATGTLLAQDMRRGIISWQMKRVGAAWLFNGDQRLLWINVGAAAVRNVCSPGIIGCVAGSATGLRFKIDNTSMQPIGSAVVKGPGLPTTGVTLTAQVNNSGLQLPWCSGCVDSSLYEMTDTMISALPANASYTVALYSTATPPVQLATYTEVASALPVLNTALATLAWPYLGGMTPLAGFPGGTLTPTWDMAAGLTGQRVSAYVYQLLSGSVSMIVANQYVDFDLAGKPGAGTASMAITPPQGGGVWSGGGYEISASDADGRRVSSHYR